MSEVIANELEFVQSDTWGLKPWHVVHNCISNGGLHACAESRFWGMKCKATCGMHCELRISVNELNFERIVQLCDIPKGEFDSCLGNMSHATQLLCALFVPACDDWCKLNGIICACVHRCICKLWICCFVQLN